MPAGRPASTRTPEVEAKIVAAVLAGCSMKVAASAGGVRQETANRWFHEVPEFRLAIQAARCDRVRRWLAVVEEAAKTDYKAATWLLERCEPEDYGRSVKQAVQEEIKSFLAGLQAKLGNTPAWKEIIIAAYESSDPGAGSHVGSDGH